MRAVAILACAIACGDAPAPAPPDAPASPPWKAKHPEFSAREGQPPQPRGAGFVLDDTYKDPAIVEGLLRAYHERHPEITALVEIGRSVEDRSIWALEISDAVALHEDEPAVLFDGGHHASEMIATEYVLDAIDLILTDPSARKWIDGLEIWCVPMVNPDGTHAYIHESREHGRANANGVDLNRNYPFAWGGLGSTSTPGSRYYHGPAPASEPETKAIIALANTEHFAAALSFHVWGTALHAPYLAQNHRDPEPDIGRVIGNEIGAAAPRQPGGRTFDVRSAPYPVAGSAHDWHFFAHGAIAFVVEGSHWDPEPEIRKRSIEGIRPVWMAMLDRVLDGPWIGGHVRNANGEPVVAEVMLAEIRTFEGESWKSRARDGRLDRAVIGPGRYTLVVRAEGHAPIERVIEIGGARVDVDIVLP